MILYFSYGRDLVRQQRWMCNVHLTHSGIEKNSLAALQGVIGVRMHRRIWVYLEKHTHRSAAMATKCRIDAVQQSTSHDVQMSHSSGPRIQPLLIWKCGWKQKRKMKICQQFTAARHPHVCTVRFYTQNYSPHRRHPAASRDKPPADRPRPAMQPNSLQHFVNFVRV